MPDLVVAKETILIARDIISNLKAAKLKQELCIGLCWAVAQVAKHRVGGSTTLAINLEINAEEASAQMAVNGASHTSSAANIHFSAVASEDSSGHIPAATPEAYDTDAIPAARVSEKVATHSASPMVPSKTSLPSPMGTAPGSPASAISSKPQSPCNRSATSPASMTARKAVKSSYGKGADGLLSSAAFDPDSVHFHKLAADKYARR